MISNTFFNINAWFSSSVDDLYKQLWVENGGIIVEEPTRSQFMFSNDSESQDTKSLFSWYVVLKPRYIDACLARGDMHQTKFSSYMLYPREVVQEISTNVRRRRRRRRHQREGPPVCIHRPQSSLMSEERNLQESVQHVDDVPKYSGVLEDFVPGINGCEVEMI